MKYIIAVNGAGMQMCFLFDAHIRHKDVCKSACEGMTVQSAGVCKLGADRRILACGESRSLNTESRAEDSDILTKFVSA